MKTPILIHSEILTLLECASIALREPATFNRIAEHLDLLDKELSTLRDRLEAYLTWSN